MLANLRRGEVAAQHPDRILNTPSAERRQHIPQTLAVSTWLGGEIVRDEVNRHRRLPPRNVTSRLARRGGRAPTQDYRQVRGNHPEKGALGEAWHLGARGALWVPGIPEMVPCAGRIPEMGTSSPENRS